MAIFIALLRGINVSGQKPMRMERLRACCEGLGCTAVRSYIQSGNLVFAAGEQHPARLAAALQQEIAREFGFQVPVTIRSQAELARVAGGNPFLAEPGMEPARLHVTFFSAAPSAAAAEKLAQVDCGPDRLHLQGRELFLHCPEGYGRTRLSNTFLEKLFSLQATTRNWKTVGKLSEMAGEPLP